MKVCLQCETHIQAQDWFCKRCHWRPENRDGLLIFSPELLEETTQFFDKEKFKMLYLWFRARNKLILWVISTFFSNSKNFLEVGCGTGYVISSIKKTFTNLVLCAADIFQEPLFFVRERLNDAVTLMQIDARRIPFVEEFDLIGAFDVLEHIQEDESVLKQFHLSLTSGGGVILTVPQHPALWSASDIVARHVRRYTINELQKKLTRNGFEIVFTTSYVTSLLPLLAITRMLHKKKVASSIELNRSKLLNQALEKILDLEILFIKSGARFPVGGTRLVVAKKI